MGYTHHWTQTRDFDADEFATIMIDILAILADAEQRYEIAICDGAATPHSRPEVTADRLAFNGTDIDDRGHETFELVRVRVLEAHRRAEQLGWGFCKTARKPYDVAVTAVLCYLASIVESHAVSSDGCGRDFLAGLALARQALPRYANRLDIPRGILEADRWCGPYVRLHTRTYQVRFCIDRHAYVLDRAGRSLFRFLSHHEAAQWLVSHREPGRGGNGPLFDATGWFDDGRTATLANAQERVLAALVAAGRQAPADLGRRLPPPAIARPDELPEVAAAPSLAALLALGAPGSAEA